MRYKVFTTVKSEELKKRRRRIGEFTKEVYQYKQTLSINQLINLELKIIS
jgi:hypothetical protein